MENTLEKLREDFKKSLDEGRYDEKLAKRFFIQWLKGEQVLVRTHLGTRAYVPSENRYKHMSQQSNVLVWLRERIREISPEADVLITHVHLTNLFKELISSPEIQGKEEVFDSREDLINTKSGVLQLCDDGVLRKLKFNEVDAKFTVCINANYIPREERSLTAFRKFMEGSFPQDALEENMILLFQCLGHMYSNYRKKKCLLYFVGDADTGKSSLQKMFEFSVMGGAAIDEGLITYQSLHQLGNTAGTLKALEKALWLISGETASTPLKNIDLIKAVSSHDGIQETVKGISLSFVPRSKIWVCGNWESLTAFAVADFDAIKARIVPVIFEKQQENQSNPKLLQELLQEIDSIFSYAIDSWADLMKNGYNFTLPQKTEEKLEKRMIYNNSFLMFLEEHCTPDPTEYVYFEELYEVYMKYSSAKERDILSKAECRRLFFQRTKEVRPNNNGLRNRARLGYKLLKEPLLDLQCELLTLDDVIDTLRQKKRRKNLTEFEKVLVPFLEFVSSDVCSSPINNHTIVDSSSEEVYC